MIDGPRPAMEEEYDELMRLLERSYYKVREYFQDGWPQIWRRENVEFENRFIIKKDGKIVSHVGLMPLDLIVNGKIIKAGGIGGVGTDPDFRGLGFMSELLKYAITKMKEKEFPISVLWGDRQRYGSYGWEFAGANFITILTKRNLEKLDLAENVEVEKYTGEDDILDKIIEIHDLEPLRVKRDQKTYKMLLSKPGQEVWVGKGEKGWAYLVSNGEKEKNVIERGGDPGVFLILSLNVLKKTGAETLRIYQPAQFTPLTEVLFKVCSRWSIEPLTMLKIIDLNRTLQDFGAEAEGMKFKMVDANENKFETLKISGKEINLTEQAMVRLLFGPLKPSKSFKIEPELAKALDSIFPFNFYVWQLDHI